MNKFVVVMDTNGMPDGVLVYGPTEDEDTARDFAAFLTAEVDPAIAVPLRSPTKELLAAWKHHEESQ